jgi:colanic acid/amylovoran biosynthesis glycosyltransferase
MKAYAMRLLFVLGEFPVLSETFVLDQITGLIDRGMDVAVLARRPRVPAPEHRAVAEYGLLPRTHYYADTPVARFRALPRLATWFGAAPLSALRALGRSCRFDLYGLDSIGLGPMHRAAAAREAQPVDAVVAHFGPNGLKALELRELGMTNAPIVTVFHGHDLSRWAQRHGALGYRRLFSQAERMLPISEHGRARLIELGCPAQKVEVHRMGVDLAARTPSAELPTLQPSLVQPGRVPLVPRNPAGEIHVLSVGRLVEKKGFEFALRALQRALADGASLHYHLIGDGPLRASLEALVTQLEIEGHVTFHGQLAREQVEAIRRRAQLALVPSVTAADGDEEGIPVVVMEAMAAGLAVIATRHAGIPELVIDGETGLLVPERDSQALAAALGRLLGDAALYARLTRGARARVMLQHDLGRQNDGLARLLERVVREARGLSER